MKNSYIFIIVGVFAALFGVITALVIDYLLS